MGSIDCCQRGIKNELTFEIVQEHIQDKEVVPQDKDQAFRSKKIEVENTYENMSNSQEEVLNQEKNTSVIEICKYNLKEIEQNEIKENNRINADINIPNIDNNVIQENNITEIKEYNSANNGKSILENDQKGENIVNQGININSLVQIELHVKSKYILKKIFNILPKRRLLDIIKYNKKLQKGMSIIINDYKEYSEIYSSIEIEIIPIINKNGRFINITRKNEKYYHIYFNDDKEEIKRYYINNDKVSKIKVKIGYQVKSFSGLFYECKCIESMNFKLFNRNNIIDISYMFSGCSSLKELNLNNFNTNNVTNMGSMFDGCIELKELNLHNFNTNNVTNMYQMFCGCVSLKELDLNNFNTTNVTNMIYMFCGCSSLRELNLNNFEFRKVKKYKETMFYNCSSELKIKISGEYIIKKLL